MKLSWLTVSIILFSSLQTAYATKPQGKRCVEFFNDKREIINELDNCNSNCNSMPTNSQQFENCKNTCQKTCEKSRNSVNYMNCSTKEQPRTNIPCA